MGGPLTACDICHISIRLQEITLAQLGADDVSVEMLASPVNPVDVNVIQGTYGVGA